MLVDRPSILRKEKCQGGVKMSPEYSSFQPLLTLKPKLIEVDGKPIEVDCKPMEVDCRPQDRVPNVRIE